MSYALSCLMHNRNKKPLKAVWEFVEDSHAEECLRRVLRLILSETPEISPAPLDDDRREGLNEDVPVEDKQI